MSQIRLGLKDEGVKSYLEVSMAVEKSELSHQKKEELRKEIDDLIENIKERGDICNKDLGTIEDHYASLRQVPSVTNGRSDQFPVVSNNVEICFNQSLGRHSVVKQDVSTGDVVCVEKPFAAALRNEYFLSHCQSCFIRVVAPLPCSKCCDVVFCSITCQKSHFHEVECSVLKNLWQLEIPGFNMLSLRMVTQFTAYYLHKNRNQFVDRDYRDMMSLNDNDNELTFVYNLCHHENITPSEEHLKYAILATFYIKMLRRTTYFTSLGNQKSEIELLIGSLIMRYLAIRRFNCHVITGLKINDKLNDSKIIELGRGLYPAFTLFNHSCSSPLARYFCGSQLVVTATKTVKSGFKIPDTYGFFYDNTSEPLRKAKLYESFWFDCSCEACLMNWSTIGYTSPVESYICPHCKDKLHQFKSNNYKCFSCQNVVDISPLKKILEDCNVILRRYSNIKLESDIDLAIKELNGVMTRLLEVVFQPSKIVTNLWKKLLQVYLIKGNLYNESKIITN